MANGNQQTDPPPNIVHGPNGVIRGITENGCVTGLTVGDVMRKHGQRMAARRAKGWAVNGRGRV